MSDSKKSGRKSPVDRSGNAAEFPSTRVNNVTSKPDKLDTGEQRAKIGKQGKKG